MLASNLHYDLKLDSLISIDTTDCQTSRQRSFKQPKRGYQVQYLTGEEGNWKSGLNIQKEKFSLYVQYGLNDIQNIIYDDTVVWVPSKGKNLEISAYSVLNGSKESVRSQYQFRHHAAINDANIIWFQDNFSIVFFDKVNEYFFQTPIRSTPRNLKVDSNKVYFNSSHGFHIYSKNYLVKESINVRELNNMKIEFDRLLKEYGEILDFRTAYKFYASNLRKYSDFNHQEMLIKIGELKRHLAYLIPRDLNEAMSLEKNYFDSITYDDVKVACYLRLMEMANHTGNLNISLRYDSVLIEDFPEFRTKHHQKGINAVLKAHQELKKIEAANLKEDKVLWLTGKVHYELVPFVGPDHGSYYDMSYPFQYFKELVNKYPKSKFSFKAEEIMKSQGY